MDKAYLVRQYKTISHKVAVSVRNRFLFLNVIILTLAVAGCQMQTSTVTADFRNQEGIYVVAYTADSLIRKQMENQLASDLRSIKILAKTSFQEIEDITSTSPEEVIRKAKDADLVAILVINQVGADGSNNIVKNPKRISPMHPTLQEFYAYSKLKLSNKIGQDQEVFAEVNLFVIDKGEAKLYWSGTTWSFQADNKGTAIRDISKTVVSQLEKLRDKSK